MGFTLRKYVDQRKVDKNFKERYKQYYQNNKDKIIETNKKYYYDNREALLHYYASISHIYIEKRRHDREYKAKQREYYKTYYQVYKERPIYIYIKIIILFLHQRKILLLVFLLTSTTKKY